VKNTALEG